MTAKKKTTTKKKPKSIWQTLSVINVNEYTEDKGSGNFKATYLSWSWAWGILMEHYPDATFTNHTNDDGYPCFFDHNGFAMVRVTLWIGEKSHTEDFMVTGNSNSAIKNPDSFAINTALKRCLVKCMAYFGLGHYIYAGEDLPREEAEAVKEAEVCKQNDENYEPSIKPDFSDLTGIEDDFNANAAIVRIHNAMDKNIVDKETVLKHFNAKSVKDLSDEQMQLTLLRISEKRLTDAE